MRANWSPDGRQIAFEASAGGAYDGYVINATGGKARKLDAPGSDVRFMRWSLDGQWLIFQSGQSGGIGARRVPAAGGAASPAETDWLNQQRPQEARYFPRGRALWTRTDEGKEREVFRFEGITQSRPLTSRDGIYLPVNATANKPGDLMFYRLPNGPLTKVAGVEGMSSYGLSISPDGRYLLYTKMVSSGSDLMLVENFK